MFFIYNKINIMNQCSFCQCDIQDGHHVCRDNTECWYRDGKFHRDDGPAIIHTNGDKLLYRNGKHHRENFPAVVKTDGTKEWWNNDMRYRVSRGDLVLWEKFHHNI